MREHRMPTTSPRSVAELSNSKTKLYAEAVSIAERYVEWARQQHGEDHLEYGRAIAALAKAYHSQGGYAKAEPLYQKALAITEKTLGADHPSVAVGLTDLAELYQDEERLTKRLNGRRAQKLRHRSLRWRHGQLKARGKLQR